MQSIQAIDVKTAVQEIAAYLVEDTSNGPYYIDGWCGLGASAVLRAIAEQPPPSLLEKFNKIIHLDCLRWESRRALQRAIVDKLNLTQQVASDFDREDELDDFGGADQSSRDEIGSVATVIARHLAQYTCLVVFNNGSVETSRFSRPSSWLVDDHNFTKSGIPEPSIFGTKVLWTFRGRFRLVDSAYFKIDCTMITVPPCPADGGTINWRALLMEEAREIVSEIRKVTGLAMTPEVVAQCLLYYFSLENQSLNWRLDWDTHAPCYWVCDGVIGAGEDNQAWELARALQQHLMLNEDPEPDMDFHTWQKGASYRRTIRNGLRLDSFLKHWIYIRGAESLKSRGLGTISSLFFEEYLWQQPASSLPSGMFHEADQLRVLKLVRCTFSFSSPPFHCCPNLRFLGLQDCKNEQQLREEVEAGEQALEIFQRLWVLDVCDTDWTLPFPPETEIGEQSLATNIREVHIKNGRIWQSNLAWRRLRNLRKLRLRVDRSKRLTARIPRDDEFMEVVKLELLDLSGNSTMQVLPSLSGAACLKTLVLDGCVGLQHVGPHGLPPSLESFSLDARFSDNFGEKRFSDNARVSCISMAACVRLFDFKLQGNFPNLEELDLSHTAIKMVDLSEKEVRLRNLQRVLLMGCDQLRSISLPLQTEMYKPWQLCIGVRTDLRFVRFLADSEQTLNNIRLLKLCLSSASKDDGRSCPEDKMIGRLHSTTQSVSGASLPNSVTYCHDVNIEQITTNINAVDRSSSSLMQFQPLDFHMEIGEGIIDVPKEVSTWGSRFMFVMRRGLNKFQSLHVHDNSSITTVVSDHILFHPWTETMNGLKWCCVERCSKLDTVFAINYDWRCFSDLEIFWAAHLSMARSIWRRPRNPMLDSYMSSFTRLRAIHLHFCPSLRYVLPMASNNTLSRVLETLHIHCCGDLRQVFLVEQEFLEKIAANHEKGMLGFPNLKSLYLYELPSLQQICEAKMFAPKLDTIYIRGCRSLRRLPATDGHRCKDGRPVPVDCEKECWDKLEWDGMGFGHHPSLFEPCHSRHYRKHHLRGAVLR